MTPSPYDLAARGGPSTPSADPWRGPRRAASGWTPPRRPTVVVAPHPDDEVLLFGGLLARQRARGLPVVILALTDGEAAYPGLDRAALAARRRSEQDAAVRALAGGEVPVVRLGLPDGAVAAHEREVRAAVAGLAGPGALVAAPWALDHHCDHEAAGRAAREAARDTGAALAEGIFWGWLHGSPTALAGELVALALGAGERAGRAAALRCHASQLAVPGRPPILDRRSLRPMGWTREYFVLPRRAA